MLENGEEFALIIEQWQHFEGLPCSLIFCVNFLLFASLYNIMITLIWKALLMKSQVPTMLKP